MRYLVRERLFSITDDFWVTDERGDKVFLVDGKALRLRETFELKDASGAVLATIRKRLLSFTDTLEIEYDGAVVATVHKAVISLLHHRAIIANRATLAKSSSGPASWGSSGPASWGHGPLGPARWGQGAHAPDGDAPFSQENGTLTDRFARTSQPR